MATAICHLFLRIPDTFVNYKIAAKESYFHVVIIFICSLTLFLFLGFQLGLEKLYVVQEGKCLSTPHNFKRKAEPSLVPIFYLECTDKSRFTTDRTMAI